MIYLRLFWEFFKTGLFAVGGGLATLPFLYDMADRTGWFTRTQLADMLAVSESTPGPIGVNMATYVGYVTRGIPGAIVATLGLVTPKSALAPDGGACARRDRDPRDRGIPEGLPAQPVCGGGILRAAPGIHGHGGRSGPVRGGHHPAEHRSHGPGDCKLEGIGSGGGDPGADPLGEAHQGPAPHCVHPGLRRGGSCIQLLNTDSDISE